MYSSSGLLLSNPDHVLELSDFWPKKDKGDGKNPVTEIKCTTNGVSISYQRRRGPPHCSKVRPSSIHPSLGDLDTHTITVDNLPLQAKKDLRSSSPSSFTSFFPPSSYYSSIDPFHLRRSGDMKNWNCTYV